MYTRGKENYITSPIYFLVKTGYILTFYKERTLFKKYVCCTIYSQKKGIHMKVNTVNNQNFNGNFIITNKLSHTNWNGVQDAIWYFNRRGDFKLKRQPFDIYIRQTNKGNIQLSLDKRNKKSYLIKKEELHNAYNFENVCSRLKNDARKGIEKSSIWEQILYTLRLKKYIG